MADEYSSKIEEKHAFDIFKEIDVQKSFANLNLELLKGRHIQNDTYYIFKLLEKYFDELREFYGTFYRLNLENKTFEGITYYYLNFFEESKGVLSNTVLHKELTAIETITAITLLHMYYERQFEKIKEIKFSDIQAKIMQSEYSELYKTAFFKNGTRNDFSKMEWSNVQKNIRNVITDFDQMGWVGNVTTINENNFSFILRTSIHRFQAMYEYEISNLEEFITNLQLDANE